MTKKEISSGAKKAEDLAREDNAESKNAQTKTESKAAKKPAPAKSTAAKKSAGTSASKGKKTAKNAKKDKSVTKQEKKEEKKANAIKIKAEKKQRRLEKKLENKQHRLEKLAALKEKREERKEKRRERRDKLKNETKVMRIERKREEKALKAEARAAKRKAAAEERTAKREHRLRMKQEKRESRAQRKHAPGFGGWLAAVISLGVTTLALGTLVTLGWVNINGLRADMADEQTAVLYELNSVVDNLDGNLAKARVANSAPEQARLLSDIAIESEMAEMLLERMPLECNAVENMTAFINKMGDSAQQMLYSVAGGATLTDSQIATIEHMYQTNLEMKRALNELASTSCAKDMLAALSGKEGLLSSSFGDIQNMVIETPKEIQDGPFADSRETVNAKALEGLEEITAPEAERLAREYFVKYGVNSVTCTGESSLKGLTLYNLSIATDDGEMFAQISKLGGKVVMFDSHKDCSNHNFSVERCTDIAEDFLKDLGLENMKAVWTSENGTVCNLNFAYEQNGTIIYSDIVKVKVCEERGLVTGMEATSYVLNHGERDLPEAAISRDSALSAINGGMAVEGTRLALIPLNGSEVLTYEIYGSYGGNEYYVYVDAANGEQVQTLTVVGTKQGRALM